MSWSLSPTMRLKAVPTIVECPNSAFQAFSQAVQCPLSAGSGRRRRDEKGYSDISLAFVSNPFVSQPLPKSRSPTKASRRCTIQRSCSANLDVFDDGGHDFRSRKYPFSETAHLATSNPFLGGDRDSFSMPVMLGIMRGEDTVSLAVIEQKAKCFDIPVSLRMIKKKLKWEKGLTDCRNMSYCPVKTAFASMVFIVVEIQNHALRMREDSCDEDLGVIKSKVRKDMHSSFVWMFQQVFSRTPGLMLQVMILLAKFSVHSASSTTLSVRLMSRITTSVPPKIGFLSHFPCPYYPPAKLACPEEANLWESMVDDATLPEFLDIETRVLFVSPVSAKMEPDSYDEYFRTDLVYQVNLARDPNNTLLLCNYAKFLQLVTHDYDRAEECYKRAIQLLPPDAESLAQYANFLWTVRRNIWAAEERFLQALAADPGSSYYASRYAYFLWNTGAAETCFPLGNSNNPTV